MITKTHSTTTTEITKEQLWKLMSDVNNWKNWNDNVEYSELHGEFKTGMFFTLKPKGGPKAKIQLMDVQAPRYFRDCTLFPLAKMYGDHKYEDAADGLKITIMMSIIGPLSWLWYLLVMKDIVKNLPHDIEEQIHAAKYL